MHSDLLDRVLVGGTLRLLLLQRGMLLLREIRLHGGDSFRGESQKAVRLMSDS